mgnify:CR=1 FL=1
MQINFISEGLFFFRAITICEILKNKDNQRVKFPKEATIIIDVAISEKL